MTYHDGFDRTVTDWLDEQAGHGMPGYLDEVLARTTRTRQRPAWSSLERWLPVQATLRLTPVPRMAWLLVVLALVVALGTAILVIGSRPHPAPPFGLARNGLVTYSQDGDIFTIDPKTRETTAIVTGPTTDGAPYFSRDGQSLVFLRSSSQQVASVVVAHADGSDPRVVTGPMVDQNWFDWSPDGTRLALISTIDGVRSITITNVDGSGSHVLPIGMPTESVSWRGPGGTELLFRGDKQGGAGLFTVKVDGTDLHQVSPDIGDRIGAYQYPMTAPDGSRVAYTTFEWDPGFKANLLRLHVLDIASGDDKIIPVAPDPIDPTLPTDQGYGVFSPDGRLLAFQRYTSDGRLEIAVAPADGSALGMRVGPTMAMIPDSGGPSLDFSPDATAVIVTYRDEGVVRVLPIDGSDGYTVPWDGTDLPSMQRLAP